MTDAITLPEHSEDTASKTPDDALERQVAQVAEFLEAVQQSLVRCQHGVVRVHVQLVGAIAVSHLALARSDVDSLKLDDQLRIIIGMISNMSLGQQNGGEADWLSLLHAHTAGNK